MIVPLYEMRPMSRRPPAVRAVRRRSGGTRRDDPRNPAALAEKRLARCVHLQRAMPTTFSEGHIRLRGLPTSSAARRGGRLGAMHTATKVYESDEQGIVHVDVPVGRPGQRVEVLVVWNDLVDSSDAGAEQAGMADLVGLLEVGDLERFPQGEYEKRDPIS